MMLFIRPRLVLERLVDVLHMQKKREIKFAGVAWGELRSVGCSTSMLPSGDCLKFVTMLSVKILAFTKLKARL